MVRRSTRTAAAALLCLVFAGLQAEAGDIRLENFDKQFNDQLTSSKLEDAARTAEQWIAEADRAFGSNSVELATALNAQATILHLEGRVGDADPIFENVLKIYKAKLPADDLNVATALNNVGMQHVWMGRFSEAPKFLQEALQIREKQLKPDDPAIIDSLTNLTYAYLYLERMDEALAFAQRAKALVDKGADKNHDRVIRVLQNLASAQERQGNYQAAEKNLSNAVKFIEKSLPESDTSIASAKVRLALNLYLQSRFSQAEPIYRDAIERLEHGPLTLTIPAAMTDFAMNQMEQGKLDEAGALLEKGLRLRQKLLPPDNPEIARTTSNLAEVKFRKGDFAAAQDLNRQAVAMISGLGKRNDISLLQFTRLVRSSWALYHSDTDAKSLSEYLEEGFAAAQRAVETGTAKTVAHMAARFAASDPKLRDLVKQLQDLESEDSALQRRISHALSLPIAERATLLDDANKQLATLQVQKANVYHQVEAEFPQYAGLANPQPVTLRDITQLLNPNEALIFIAPLLEATWVFAVTHDRTVWQRVELASWDVDKFVSVLRKQILVIDDLKAGKKPPLFDLGFSHDLYSKIFGGVAPSISGKSHLLIAASGAFDRLPFQLLVTEKPQVRRPTLKQFSIYKSAAWMVRDYAISVLPSVASLPALRNSNMTGHATKPLIGFANPVLASEAAAEQSSTVAPASAGKVSVAPTTVSSSAPDTRTVEENAVDRTRLSRELPALPEAEKELRTVASFVGASTSDLLIGAAATETAVKHAPLSEYRTIYFATHGLMAGELPSLEQPALVMSLLPLPNADDDGLLMASEIASLKLDADMVVLSACNTAAPQSGGSEGLSGLARAFIQAGARSLLVSHWAVPSEAAAKLTTGMFDFLRKNPKIGRAQALRRSILALQADTTSSVYSYPTFWAPFVLVGDGRQ